MYDLAYNLFEKQILVTTLAFLTHILLDKSYVTYTKLFKFYVKKWIPLTILVLIICYILYFRWKNKYLELNSFYIHIMPDSFYIKISICD